MPRPLRVVIADDALASARSLVSALDLHGFASTVHDVHSLTELTAALAGDRWDLLLIAVRQPDGLADKVLDWIGRDPSAPPIVLVAPGEAADDGAALAAVRRGAREYVAARDVLRFVAAVERELQRRSPDAAHAADEPELRASRLRDQIRLQRMQKMEAVGRLAGGIAHDFNNIVQAIGGYTELLMQDMSDADPRRRILQQIRHAGERAASLTRQLLAFSRQQVLQPRVLDLNDVVRTTEGLLERLIGADVDLRADLGPELWAVRADAMQIEQVLMNLVVNARDALPAGGRITIQTSNAMLDASAGDEHFAIAPGSYVCLSVTDDGVGMSAEVRRRAFEPFFTTKPLGQGTGLGLSTVYGIVKQSGGYIWVDSTEGAGTSVRVYLPRVREAVIPAERRPAAVDPGRGVETLLVVEDEDGVRDLIQECLASHGYTVLSARHGVHALEVAESFPGRIDLLVADVVMPAMGGPALAQRLLPLRPGLKVMFMSGYADATLGDRRLLDSEVPFLQKPFSLTTLVGKVRETLEARADSPCDTAA